MHWSTSHEDKEDPEDGARAEAEAAQEEEEDTALDPDQDQDPPGGTEIMATAAETDTAEATAIQTLNKAIESHETEDNNKEEGSMTMNAITRTRTNKQYSYKGSK